MRLSVILAVAAMAVPTAPVLAHCRTVHHKIHHRVAARAPIHHRAVRYASACRCESRSVHRNFARRAAVYPMAYERPRVVEVTYERPLPIYRPYRVGYAVPLYRPRPIFYRAGFERPYFHHRWERFGGYRHERWGGYRDHRRGGWR